jgi:hypothetical protein
MIFRQLLRVCSEELRKAKRAVVSAYEIVREADERTLELLLIFLGIR